MPEKSVREKINAIAAQRILVLDGAMGSMIQKLKLTEEDFRGKRFADHKINLKGCNDLLCLVRPEIIAQIHEAYLKAGADIIETCTFNSTAVSLADYGLGDLAHEISFAAAGIARKAADKFSAEDKPRFVAGSLGPTAKSASLSVDINWEKLESSYYDNARGLLDGGVDIFIVETVFDSLNAKAALFAIGRLLEERKADIPVIVSATVSGDSGRLLSGQTVEAFCVSVKHAAASVNGDLLAAGLNCSFGAEKLLPHLRRLSAAAPCMVIAYPNAGLPNQLGSYDESPQTMAACIEQYLKDGLVNIIGGCCGSTPDHIAAIAGKAALYNPRQKSLPVRGLALAGLEPLLLPETPAGEERDNFTLIGERTNVAGSKKFLRLISEKNYRESLVFARRTIEEGASVLNVGMDDAMLDAEKSMCDFLDFALSDPDIARVPIMIDSSRWNVIEAGLKRLQGKGLVNSINLKDGEDEFLRRVSLVRRYGAAAVVMLIDEKGQAVSFERKIEIAARAYRLLGKAGFPLNDIVFDPNVLAVATGIAGNDSCAIDFIRACAWIRDNCRGVQISGGISNLSYSFRGNNTIREAMHSVFLYHARAAGLGMAIVNPSALIAYNTIEKNLREAAEDLVLNRRPDAAEKLLETAGQMGNREKKTEKGSLKWRDQGVESRIVHAMVNGLDDYIEIDLLELQKTGKLSELEIIEGPLMDGMKEVGKRFEEGAMYLPQVIRSAGVMKKAASALSMSVDTANFNMPKIILATVKGDVHDIGKNIVGVVLSCSGYQVMDLGVMAGAETIIGTAEKENAAIIGLSGLISPSLDEMAHVAREMEKRKMKIPLLIGGAAASLVHTALRIATEYSGPVVYVPNAGKASETVRALLSDSQRPLFLQNLTNSYRDAKTRHEAFQAGIEIIPIEAARANRVPPASYTPVAPKITGIIDLNDYPLEKVIPRMDWPAFLRQWEDVSPKNKKRNSGLLDDAKKMLKKVSADNLLCLRGAVGIFPAVSVGDDVIIGEEINGFGLPESRRFSFPRSRQKKPAGEFNPCLADFILPAKDGKAADWLGLFALSAGFGMEKTAREFGRRKDDYGALLLASLANSLADAFAEEVHFRTANEWWGFAGTSSGKHPSGIRPAFGYPACPNHGDKRIVFDLLEAEKRCGLKLTESAMIVPAASVCGMIFASPSACYFGIGSPDYRSL